MPNVGNRIGQLNQGWDENINITSEHGRFRNIEDAQAKANEVAASDDEDAVILRNDEGEFEVFGTDEIGELDPDGNDGGKYQIHDLEPVDDRVVSFTVTERDSSGNKTGTGEIDVIPSSSDGRDSNMDVFVRQLNNSSIPDDIKEDLMHGQGITREEAQDLSRHFNSSRTQGGAFEGIRKQNDAQLMQIFQNVAMDRDLFGEDGVASLAEIVYQHSQISIR